ncbi:MAG: HAD family hydrolase [Finegoldia sp.]|nr:HAD family hydrolase [Finegoldia sp.]
MNSLIIDFDSLDDFKYMSQLVKGLKRKGVKVAIVSQESGVELDHILSELDLKEDADLIVSLDDFTLEETNIYDLALRKLERAYEDVILFTSNEELVKNYASSDLKTASLYEDNIHSDIQVNDIRDIKFEFDYDTNLNGVYKVRAKTKEFLKNIFFIDYHLMADDMEELEIYAYYEDSEIRASILIEDDRIINGKADNDDLLNILKDRYKDKDINEIG